MSNLSKSVKAAAEYVIDGQFGDMSCTFFVAYLRGYFSESDRLSEADKEILSLLRKVIDLQRVG